jgi:hypothetical protein
MPQGQGYGTVLAGQDPSQPAIEQSTGQPLTMEALLARRGLLSVGGGMNVFNQMARGRNGAPGAAPVTGADMAGSVVDAATGGNPAGASNAGPGALPGINAPGGDQAVPAGATAATGDPLEPQTSDDDGFLKLLAGAAALGGGAWAINKLRQLYGQRAQTGQPITPEEVNALVVQEKQMGDMATTDGQARGGPQQQRMIGGAGTPAMEGTAAAQATAQRKLPAPPANAVRSPRTGQRLAADDSKKSSVKVAMIERSRGKTADNGASAAELRKRPADASSRVAALKKARMARVRVS